MFDSTHREGQGASDPLVLQPNLELVGVFIRFGQRIKDADETQVQWRQDLLDAFLSAAELCNQLSVAGGLNSAQQHTANEQWLIACLGIMQHGTACGKQEPVVVAFNKIQELPRTPDQQRRFAVLADGAKTSFGAQHFIYKHHPTP